MWKAAKGRRTSPLFKGLIFAIYSYNIHNNFHSTVSIVHRSGVWGNCANELQRKVYFAVMIRKHITRKPCIVYVLKICVLQGSWALNYSSLSSFLFEHTELSHSKEECQIRHTVKYSQDQNELGERKRLEMKLCKSKPYK